MNDLLGILRQYWGYESFRPLQAEAMAAVVAGRDSVVVLPTGGGKSLCFQAPALQLPGLAVVVSPLISLMKDQVDALVDAGVPAACVNSMTGPAEKQRIAEEIRAGRLKLLYLSPERLMTQQTLQFLHSLKLSFFAIDEAHCISDWGHDFRPEYRMLKVLKEQFPGVALHAYTATATERVRQDIARELGLREPEILVGSFDRPNLVYRVARRTDRLTQLLEIIGRHAGESGILYCIRRKDVDDVCARLTTAGHSALPYHAGLDDDVRRANQDAFINDQAKIIVATVAFGMGIDKSDVRYVVHAGMPKSLEGYQQESGRAGRDGLEAECCLLYSGADFFAWRHLQSELSGPAAQAAETLLQGINRFCSTLGCRHRAIIEYFGQEYPAASCEACDVCLGELEFLPDSLVTAQKIISCVLRLNERFGAMYTAQVLVGSQEQRILSQGHDKLSTYGLLKEQRQATVREWIEQLVEQNALVKDAEYETLQVTTFGRQVLRGEVTPQLLKPADKPQRQSKAMLDSWEGVDRGLFEDLRALRLQKARAQGMAPYVVFSDATLRDLARRRPSTVAAMLDVHGIGQTKAAQYGEEFVTRVVAWCREHVLPLDVPVSSTPRNASAAAAQPMVGTKKDAFALFAQGKSVDEVAAALSRARSTTTGYLDDFLVAEGITDPTGWVDEAAAARVLAVRETQPDDRLKPIFDALDGSVPFDEIRIVLTCRRNRLPPTEETRAAAIHDMAK